MTKEIKTESETRSENFWQLGNTFQKNSILISEIEKKKENSIPLIILLHYITYDTFFLNCKKKSERSVVFNFVLL